MRSGKCGTVILALATTLGVFTTHSQGQTSKPNQATTRSAAAAAQQNVPAEYEDGIAQLRVAKGYLEKAGNKWGGYRIKGIGSIDRAFKALGVSPESTPQEMESGNVDEPTMMNSGIASLQEAKADFAKAGNNWGGRKARAVALIDQALQDLQTAISWAQEHQTY
ncbi:MAG TPA: hypothetical protein VGG14_13400 [Candidatus Sulfotelmatobacter sp.]|jgi:hypothetical protein